MKTVLVTGAGGNLGGAVVKRFLSDGYQVLALVAPERAPKEITTGVTYFEVDLFKEAAVGELLQTITIKYPVIDAALLLAGGFEAGAVDLANDESLRRMYSLNFETAYHIARPMFAHMMQQSHGGRIIFIGARPTLDPQAGKDLIAYGLSKSLLFKLSEYLNAAGAEKNVVTAVAVPSTIDTPANRVAMPKADFSSWRTPEAIAEVLAGVAHGEVSLTDSVILLYGKK